MSIRSKPTDASFAKDFTSATKGRAELRDAGKECNDEFSWHFD